MSKSDLFKQHVLEQLYGKPESDSDHESEDESSTKPGLEETSDPPVSGPKVYGAALPPNWPQDSSGQDVNGTQQPLTSADHSSSHSGSPTSSDSEDEEYHKRRKRKRRRGHAGNAQSSEQQPSGDSHKQNNSSNSQTPLSKNQKRKQKKKRQQKRRKEEERKQQQQQTDSSPPQTGQPGTFVYEGSAQSALEEEENKRKEDFLKRLKDVTNFLDAVVDVYNRDMTLQDKAVETWSGSESQTLQTAVLSCEDSLQEVELLSRAKSTALLGHRGLASEARLQLCQQSSLPGDLIKFVSTMLEYWITDVMKKA